MTYYMEWFVPTERIARRDVSAMNSLLRQLSGRAAKLTSHGIREVCKNASLVVIRAKVDDRIIGMGSVFLKRKVTGIYADIEDVVVDTDWRGMNLGALIMNKLEEHARERGAKCIDLTSHPSRRAANGMYTSRGYQRRDANVYRLFVSAPAAAQ